MRSFTTFKGDPPVWVKFLTDRASVISLVSLIAAIGYGLFAITPDATENTRISENALLPGVVDENFDQRERISSFSKEIRLQFKEGNVKEYIKSKLHSFGVETYSQNFQFNRDRFRNETGSNVYGIVRAYRSPPVEAILVVVPVKESHIDSIALGMALQTYCREQVYWARDIIFLFAEHAEIGLEAWLAAYHGSRHSFVSADALEAHGGAIIGATVLDVVGSRFVNLNIQFNMINGKLPNLDLFNLYVRLAEKFQLRACIYGLCRQHSYTSVLNAVVRGVFTQAFYEVEGLHSVFGGYGINAVSLQAHERKKTSENGTPLWRIGQIVEGGLRSMNNILEKFHQSYFLYILATPRKFISVAYYMPIVGLVAAPMLLFGLREWFNVRNLEIPSAAFLSAHMLAVLIYLVGTIKWPAILEANMQQEIATNRGLQTILAIILQLPILALFKINSPSSWVITKFFLYLEAALFIGALSLINFSLALVLGICIVPAVLFFTIAFPNSTKMSKLKKLLIIFFHPLIFVYLFHLISHHRSSSPTVDLYNDVISASKKVVASMNIIIHRHLFHSSITFPVFSIFVLSVYYLLLLIVYYGN